MTIKALALSEILLDVLDSRGEDQSTLRTGITVLLYPHFSILFYNPDIEYHILG